MGADAAAGAVDQDLLSGLDLRLTHEVQRVQATQRYRSRFFETHVGGLGHDRVACRQGDKLAVGTQT